ncbi:MAG TPA: PUA domain-containing protein [Candidatus Limnocylindrales bacterium]|nr:PUA domain-containing protein [Candidatus Limnocylindrales bacterium]
MKNELAKTRTVADYQFGKGIGVKLFPENVKFEYSPRTGRIRFINLDGKRIATLRPTDGLFSLSIRAARFMRENTAFAHCFVTVKDDVSEYIAAGGDVFAVHVVKVDSEIRASDEVIALDEAGNVLAVGKATLSSLEITAFKSGVAVKVRHGTKES